MIPGWFDLVVWLNHKAIGCRTVKDTWWWLFKAIIMTAMFISIADGLLTSIYQKEIVIAKIAYPVAANVGSIDVIYSTETIPRCPVVLKQRITGCGEYDIGSIRVDSFPPEKPVSIMIPEELLDGSGEKAVCQYSAIIEYNCGDDGQGSMVQKIPFVVNK